MTLLRPLAKLRRTQALPPVMPLLLLAMLLLPLAKPARRLPVTLLLLLATPPLLRAMLLPLPAKPRRKRRRSRNRSFSRLMRTPGGASRPVFFSRPPSSSGGGTGRAAHQVPVSIRDAQRSDPDRAWIHKQYPEYLDDLSQLSMNTGMFPASGEFGEREPELMARWFADDSSHPLLILKDERPIGFALVSRPPRNQRENVDFRMAEFFITAKARRLGAGRDAAMLIFNRFSGAWEVMEFLYNKPAVTFWRSVVAKYTGGKFRESVAHGEVKQVFNSTSPSTRR